ncbi:MAG: class I SAM-dependent methyltransferase [Nitrososphaerales archaeon]
MINLSLAPFVSSSEKVVYEMLKLAELKAGELLYDLGSGDGRILIIAAKDFGARAIGIELNESLVKRTIDKIRELNLEDKIKVIHGDFMNVDISDANVVTLYLTERGNEIVKPKLEKELKSGTRVVSHNYEIRGWKPIRIKEVEWRRIYLYEVKK